MLSSADNTETETPIRTDLRAIFVSLELSRTTWLVTSLSPGTREKMSKHSVPAGDIGGAFNTILRTAVVHCLADVGSIFV